jgi:hypothetical protein
MARRRDYSAQAKTIAASTTNTFPSSEIPSSGIVAYHFGWTGSSLFTHISRLRIKANGVAIYDLSPSMLRAFVRRFSRSNYPIPDGQVGRLTTLGTASASTTSQPTIPLRRFSIPLFLLDDSLSEAQRDSYQMPKRSQVTIEIQWGSSASAGSLYCGWTETNVPAAWYPKLYGSQANIAASVANGRANLQDDGNVYAVGVNTVGLERFKVVLGGIQLFHGQGISVAGTATGDLISEMEQLENGFTNTQENLITTPSAASNNFVDADLVDPVFVKIDGPQAVPGSSYCELQTGSGWAGASNEITVHAVVPQAAPPAGG